MNGMISNYDKAKALGARGEFLAALSGDKGQPVYNNQEARILAAQIDKHNMNGPGPAPTTVTFADDLRRSREKRWADEDAAMRADDEFYNRMNRDLDDMEDNFPDPDPDRTQILYLDPEAGISI